ncbi:MAG: MATE family efflux transporter [Eubacteriaceae bacterium]|jgi:putative MATE family efflux protein|nr:MATE family efflux transporter [Eubacteriaceae bacterium]
MAYVKIDEESRGLYKTLAKVALPIALQSLIGSSLNLVDNLMVGALGESELAAVGVGVQIFMVFFMLIYGFSSGCSTFIAQYHGAGNRAGIKKTMGFTFMVCISIGVIFFIGGEFFPEKIIRIFTDIPETVRLGTIYVRAGAPCFLIMAFTQTFETSLRATQQTHLPMISSVTAFAANTFLNYVLIFGHFGAPALGVGGSAEATVLSRMLQAVVLVFIVFVRRNIVAGTPREYFGWPADLSRRILKNSVPTMLNESLWGLGTAMYVAAFARVGITEYASVQAGNTIQNVFIMAAFSIGDAILILVGQQFGRGEMEKGEALAKRLLKVGMLVGLVMGLLLIAAARPIISLFNFTPAGMRYTFFILIVYGLFMSIVVYNSTIITGVLRAGGDTRFALIAETCTIWLYAVPTAFITALYLHWPIYFCILAVRCEDLIKCVILTIRIRSGKWVRNVIN